MRIADCGMITRHQYSEFPNSAFRNPPFHLLSWRFRFEVIPADGDCGLWSLGNEQLSESLAADSRSQVQWDSRRYRPRVALQHSAFRNPHFLPFVICHLYGYWLLAIGLPAPLSKNEYRYFAQNHRIESPRID